MNKIFAEHTNDSISLSTQAHNSNNQSANNSQKAGTFDMIQSFLPLILMIAAFYFFIIRPQNKRKIEHDNLIKNLKKGQKIITHSGMYGEITKVNDSDQSFIINISVDKKNPIEMKISQNAVSEINNNKK